MVVLSNSTPNGKVTISLVISYLLNGAVKHERSLLGEALIFYGGGDR